MSSATFRTPGQLAIIVAGVDQMSGGRVELGLGAGWYEAEHRAYGIPFPDVKARFDNLEEQLAIVSGLWSTPPGETFSYEGAIWQLHDSPALPKPVQPDGPPIIVGGKGPSRTPALAARYADEFNTFSDIDLFREQCTRVAAACEAIDRDPASMTFSAAVVLCCGADEAEYRRRAAAIDRDPDELRRSLGGRDARRGCGAPAGVERRRCRPHLPADARPLRPRTSRPRRRTGGARLWIESASRYFSKSNRAYTDPHGSKTRTEGNDRLAQGGPGAWACRGSDRA